MTNVRVGKEEFIRRISEKANITTKDTATVVNATLDIIVEAMANGEDIVIPKFGSFKVQHVKSRVGRDLNSNKEITIPEHDRVKFSASPSFKEAVNAKKPAKKSKKK